MLGRLFCCLRSRPRISPERPVSNPPRSAKRTVSGVTRERVAPPPPIGVMKSTIAVGSAVPTAPSVVMGAAVPATAPTLSLDEKKLLFLQLEGACRDNDQEKVRRLIFEGAPVARGYKTSAMEIACENGFAECLRILLQEGDVHDRDAERIVKLTGAALFKACKHGELKCAELLLDYGVSPNTDNLLLEETVLSKACKHGHLECVKLLLEYGAKVKRGQLASSIVSARKNKNRVTRNAILKLLGQSKKGDETLRNLRSFKIEELKIRMAGINEKSILGGKDSKKTLLGLQETLSGLEEMLRQRN